MTYRVSGEYTRDTSKDIIPENNVTISITDPNNTYKYVDINGTEIVNYTVNKDSMKNIMVRIELKQQYYCWSNYGVDFSTGDEYLNIVYATTTETPTDGDDLYCLINTVSSSYSSNAWYVRSEKSGNLAKITSGSNVRNIRISNGKLTFQINGKSYKANRDSSFDFRL